MSDSFRLIGSTRSVFMILSVAVVRLNAMDLSPQRVLSSTLDLSIRLVFSLLLGSLIEPGSFIERGSLRRLVSI